MILFGRAFGSASGEDLVRAGALTLFAAGLIDSPITACAAIAPAAPILVWMMYQSLRYRRIVSPDKARRLTIDFFCYAFRAMQEAVTAGDYDFFGADHLRVQALMNQYPSVARVPALLDVIAVSAELATNPPAAWERSEAVYVANSRLQAEGILQHAIGTCVLMLCMSTVGACVAALLMSLDAGALIFTVAAVSAAAVAFCLETLRVQKTINALSRCVLLAGRELGVAEKNNPRIALMKVAICLPADLRPNEAQFALMFDQAL